MEKMREMLLAAQEGRAEAFDWLYKETYSRNYYIVLKMVKQEQDAMDILQDAYVKVFQNLSSFHYTGSKSFASWTAKIASNTALDFLRKKQPLLFSDLQADGEKDGQELDFADESAESQPELALDQKETSRIVREMLECLSEEQRICIMFRYVRQMKISEIAEECGCSENTVKSRLNYAKKRLFGERETLERKGIRLYNVAPFTLLVLLLGEDVKAACVPVEMAAASAGIFQQAFGGQAAGTVSAGTASVGTVSAGAGTAAGAGAGKIVAAVVASALVAGAGMAAFVTHRLDEELDRRADVAAAAVSDRMEEALLETEAVPTEEQEERTEEEVFYEYLNNVLIPEYGLADLQQEGILTMDFDNPDSYHSEENEWFEPKGIVSAYINDLDLDGQKELFVIYWEKEAREHDWGGAYYDMTGAVYEVEGDEAAFQDKIKLSSRAQDWEKRYESAGNFSVIAMEAEGRKYLLVYKEHWMGTFHDENPDRNMWISEYKDGQIKMIQEARIEEIAHDPGDIPDVGITYEDGEAKTELLYAGWGQPEKGPYPTLEEAYISFFRRKGLDVSEILECKDNAMHIYLKDLKRTKNAEMICALNSMWGDSDRDGTKESIQIIFEGTDWTNLREHVKQ